jgi:hypothetical protein
MQYCVWLYLGGTWFQTQTGHLPFLVIYVSLWDIILLHQTLVFPCSEDVHCGFLGCDALSTCRRVPLFWGTYYLHLQGWYAPTSPNGVTVNETTMDILLHVLNRFPLFSSVVWHVCMYSFLNVTDIFQFPIAILFIHLTLSLPVFLNSWQHPLQHLFQTFVVGCSLSMLYLFFLFYIRIEFGKLIFSLIRLHGLGFCLSLILLPVISKNPFSLPIFFFKYLK